MPRRFYCIAILMNFACYGAMFATVLRLTHAGAGGLMTGLSVTLFCLVYCLGSLWIGRRATSANAGQFIFAAGLMVVGSSVGALIITSALMQILWLMLFGLAGALYATPFQIMAQGFEMRTGGIGRAPALYIASWSMGAATGPFIFGLLPEQWCYGANILFGLLLCWLIITVQRPVLTQQHTEDNLPVAGADLAVLGWVACLCWAAGYWVMRTIGPVRCTELGLSRLETGTFLAISGFAQAAMAVLLCRSRRWMYQLRPLIMIVILIAASFLLVILFPQAAALYLAAFLYGTAGCALCFYATYHALAHAQKRARNVAINETISGATGIICPLLSGLLTAEKNAVTPFYGVAILMLAALPVQIWIWRGKNKTTR